MFKKNLLLACTTLISCAPLFAEDEVTRGGCKKFNSVRVCNNLTVGGSETVSGSVTAGSFILSSGDTLFNGLRNWAVFSNDGAITGPGTETILWDGAPAFTPKGISNNVGEITLPTTGTFLVMYTIRLTIAGTTALETAIAHLRQSTVAGGGGMTNITQAAITNNSNNLPADVLELQTQLSGYALITTTSTVNNVIDLTINLPAAGITIPVATTPDANAQLTILQLN